MTNSQQAGDIGVPARLRQQAFSCVYKYDGSIGGGSAGGHVARVLFVTGSIGNDELAPGRGEITISNVNGNSLLALGPQSISQKRKINGAGRAVDPAGAHRGKLVFINCLAVIQQP